MTGKGHLKLPGRQLQQCRGKAPQGSPAGDETHPRAGLHGRRPGGLHRFKKQLVGARTVRRLAAEIHGQQDESGFHRSQLALDGTEALGGKCHGVFACGRCLVGRQGAVRCPEAQPEGQ